MISYLILSISLSTIVSYLSLTLFKLQPSPLIIALLTGPVIFLKPYKHTLSIQLKKLPIKILNYKNWPNYLLILILPTAIALILSPLIRYPQINQTTFIMFNDVLDYYKHLYSITAINNHGLPPSHPYFYPGTFSYYYGYYIIPAALSILTPIPQTTILYFWVLTTSLISLSFLYQLYNKYLSSRLLTFISLTLLIIGFGLDIIPTQSGPSGFMDYIELWAHDSQIGPAVNNLYTALLWVPQHIFASVISLYILHKLISNQNTSVKTITIAYTYVILSSIFTAITLTLWSVILFVTKPQLRKKFILAAIVTAIILIPFFLNLGTRSNFLQFYLLKPYEFIDKSYNFLNYLFTIIIEYGLITFILPIFIFINRKHIPVNIIQLTIIIYLPIIITLFLKSSRANDFSMRIIHPSQMLLPLILILSLRNLKLKARYLFIIIIMLSSIYSFRGLLYEYKARYQNKFLLDPYTSELIIELRKIPKNTKMFLIGKQDWIFQIPPLAFHTILTPSLYDSGVYLVENQNQNFESEGLQIFSQPIVEKNLNQLINKRNQQFSQLNYYLDQYPYDYLLLNHKIWIQKDINPWLKIFEKINVKTIPLTSRYSFLPQASLINQTDKYKIFINDNNPTEIDLTQQQKFSLPSGVWFLTSCSDIQQELKLEIEQYYNVFTYFTTVPQCVGQLFYYPEDTPSLTLSKFSTVKNITAFPIDISPNTAH